MNACPKGWRLPDKAEWQKLVASYGGSQNAYKALILDGEHDFKPVLSGGRQPEKDFCCLGDFANYWSSDGRTATATYVDFNKTNNTVTSEIYSKQWALSCRCVKRIME